MVDTLKLQGREQSYGNHHHFMDYATTHILRVKIKEKSSILLAWEKKSILKHAQSSSVLLKNAFPQGKLLPEHHLNFYKIIRKATFWPGERKSPNLVTWF